MRPKAQPLKSGSRAQQVPVGAHAGFASAASLWKVQRDDESVQATHGEGAGDAADRKEGGEGTKQTKGTGKLTRPKKAPKPRRSSVASTKAPESPRFDSFITAREDTATLPPVPAGHGHPKNADSLKATSASRRASINLSEYSFDADVAPAQPKEPAKDTPTAKKVVRKRPSKTNPTGEAPAKKPRNPKAKSEAIILDSDEPDVVLNEKDGLNQEELPHAPEPVAKPPRSKAAKEPVKSKTRESGASVKKPKTTNKDKIAEMPTKESTEKSTYFAPPPVSTAPVVDAEHLPSSPPPLLRAATEPAPQEPSHTEHTCADLVADTSLPLAELAPRRRRSWTPAKDSLTVADNATNTIPAVNYELDENMGQIPFSAMLGNFSYLPDETVTAKRVVSGETGTKRRRIEVSDSHILPAQLVAQYAPKAKAAPKAKKPKAGPKKAQTITSLAMAPYQPAKEPDPLQSTVSAFFTPRKEVDVTPAVEGSVKGEQPVAKVKKPRKSRAKVQPVEGDTVASKKPRTKATKVKVKFDKKDHQPPLYSPTQARKQMKAQDFLFGTSSQLAAEEPPDFIREIQLAVHQSEMVCAMPHSSQIGTQLESNLMDDERSCAKVPTAPHGTSLSLEQANRALWCDGSRDFSGSKLAQEVPGTVPEGLPDAMTEGAAHANEIITLSSSIREGQEEQATASQRPLPPTDEAPIPIALEAVQSLDKEEVNLPTLPGRLDRDHIVITEARIPPTDDNWVFLHSDDPVHVPQPALERPHIPATSPARRTALQPLDANIAITAHDIISKPHRLTQVRPFSTAVPLSERDRTRKNPSIAALDDTTHVTMSPKRSRGRPRKDGSPAGSKKASPTRGPGRPRKDGSPTRPVQTSPDRRPGRPRKSSLDEGNAQTFPARGRGRPRKDISPTRVHSASPKRPVGRPRKDASPVRLPSTSPKRPRKASVTKAVGSISPKRPVGRPRKGSVASVTSAVGLISPKRPVGRPRKAVAGPVTSPQKFRKDGDRLPPKSASQPTTQDEWTRIDDISDSDSPATPSPRRRRVSSSPAFIRPLDFQRPRSRSPSPKAKLKPPAATTSASTAAIKPTDASWPAIQAVLFPQIASTITSAPTSSDLTAPSWHEKILLYDPIVLEDLTVWLNQQGLRTELERLKPKTKTKGRKKKDAPPEVDEWEVVRDELKAWMVQKWCEENSICCLWKEGLRGGVKARY